VTGRDHRRAAYDKIKAHRSIVARGSGATVGALSRRHQRAPTVR
jgi:hypothetical protein